MNTPQVLVGRELLRCTLSHLGVLKHLSTFTRLSKNRLSFFFVSSFFVPSISPLYCDYKKQKKKACDKEAIIITPAKII